MSCFSLLVSLSALETDLCVYFCFLIVHLLFGSEPTPARDPIGDVNRFVTEFEEDYGTVHPEFLRLSYGNVSLHCYSTVALSCLFLRCWKKENEISSFY